MNQLLEQSDPEASDPASANNPSSITPKSLDDAIEEALVRLDSLTHELRLQPIVRVSTKEDAQPESAYLVKGQDDGAEGVPTENQFRHRDIRIATNLIELKEACRLLQVSESTSGAPTHFMLRLNHETCLYPAALDRILTLISEHTVGTSQLSFLIPDSVQVRESIICHRLTDALRSIGCHIVIDNYNPARSSSEAIHELHASDIILEANFWERAAQNEPWATVLPQIISDVHHILGHTVTVRNPRVTHNIESSGIDYIERHSAVALSPTEFLNYFGKASLSDA
jgi:EAL domain-containing protein (putative c-di-GMP-specific phosphodiesterase class I)